MSTLLIFLLALTSIIVCIDSQTYEDCGSQTVSVGGQDLSISLARDASNSMVKITLTGPTDKWFGFVIGSGVMSGYGITGQNLASTYSLVERDSLIQYNPGTARSTPSGTDTAVIGGLGATLTLERAYTVSGSGYDFTNLMTCQVSSISIAAVIGGSLDFGKHTDETPNQSFTSTCVCTSEPTTMVPTNDPTVMQSTVIDDTDAPTTMVPTSDPTTSSATYEDCGSKSLTVGGESVTMQLGRDASNSMVKVTLTGPTDKWFGFVIGSGTMSGYGITGQNDDTSTYSLVERDALSPYGVPGTARSTPSGTTTATNTGSNGIVTLERDYTVSGSGYDFTDLMTCQVSSIDIAAAIGSSLTFEKHTNTNPRQSFTNTCCTSAPTTMVPTSDPTMMESTVIDDDTDAPTTMVPTSDPTVMESTVIDDDTDAPTGQPTAAPTKEYEVCVVPTQFVPGITVEILRKSVDKTMQIIMKGDVNKYFAFGFGSLTMAGTYSIIINGMGTTDFMERTLGQWAPGTELTGDERSFTELESNTNDGIIQTVVINRPWAQGSAFDFTPLMTCKVNSTEAISARGPSYTFQQHETKGNGQLDRICDCPITLEPTTSKPTSAPTMVPTTEVAGAGYNIFSVFNVCLLLIVSLGFVW